MTDTLMDIDDLKVAWQRLDRKLDRQNALAFEHFKDGRVRTMRARLRPLLLGQLAQCVIGAGLVVFAARTWLTHWDHGPLRTAGLVMHVYGVLVIIAGARTVHLIRQIDYAAPVVGLQPQLDGTHAVFVSQRMPSGVPGPASMKTRRFSRRAPLCPTSKPGRTSKPKLSRSNGSGAIV